MKQSIPTLKLNRISSGYYSSTHDGITVTVSNPSVVTGGKSEWQVYIENKNETILNEWAKTKSKAYEIATNYLIHNH